MATHVLCPTCGETAEIPNCPSCGAAPSDSLASTAASVADHHQNLADRDQDAGDQDQTWSDHDQSASDDDQRSADDDQQAADEDLSAGGDAASHHHSKVARDRSTHDRAVVSSARDESAAARTETAEHRDRAASLRDRAALLKDRTTEDQESVSPHSQNEYFNEIRDDILTRAKKDRARAAADRVKAADDRARAAVDREQAALARAEAYMNRSESEQNLKESTRDELTGVLTRRFGLDQASRELERAHRTGAKLILAFVDVNGLKEVNDAQGHLAGDELLRLVGKTLLSNLRSYDVVTRYGGDEFVCVMPNLSSRQARTRFDRVASILAAVHSEHSITFGLAEARPTNTLQELIAQADAALLGAKAGPN